jgi:hypothetical protein
MLLIRMSIYKHAWADILQLVRKLACSAGLQLCPKSSPPQILAEFLYLLWLSQDSCAVDAFMMPILVGHCAPVWSKPRDKNMKSCLQLVLSRVYTFCGRKEGGKVRWIPSGCLRFNRRHSLSAATRPPPRFKAKSGSLALQSSVQSFKCAFVVSPPRLCLLGALFLALPVRHALKELIFLITFLIY